MFCVFSKYHRLVGRGVGPCLYCPYTILQCFVSFLNTPAAAGSSTSLCLYCPYTIFHKLCFMSFLNTPSARPQYQGSTLFSVYHTEEPPIDFLFFLLVDRFSFPFFFFFAALFKTFGLQIEKDIMVIFFLRCFRKVRF